MQYQWPILFSILLASTCVWILYFQESFNAAFDSRLLYPVRASLRFQTNANYSLPAGYYVKHCDGFEKLGTILLAINFNFPHYEVIPVIRKFYAPVFGKVVFCGDVEDPVHGVMKVAVRKGYQGYECVATAIRLFPNFTGYIHSNDDLVINWWNLLRLDTSKIWIGNRIPYEQAHIFGAPIDNRWYWWTAENTAHVCQVAFNKLISLENERQGIEMHLPRYLKRFYQNTNNTKLCANNWSDFFYLPREYSQDYAAISDIYNSLKVYLEVAVPTILTMFVNKSNYYDLNGLYYNSIYGYSEKYKSGEAFYETYSLDLNFSHPLKIGAGKMKAANKNFFENVIIPHGNTVSSYCSELNRERRRRRERKIPS